MMIHKITPSVEQDFKDTDNHELRWFIVSFLFYLIEEINFSHVILFYCHVFKDRPSHCSNKGGEN